jgi:DNA-binding XRE family transcriptional regulator
MSPDADFSKINARAAVRTAQDQLGCRWPQVQQPGWRHRGPDTEPRGDRAPAEGELGDSDHARPPDSFGGLLRFLRLENRYTQEDLAERTGLSVRTIVDLEGGRVRRPRHRSIQLLADALGLNAAQRESFADLATRDYWAGRQRQGRVADN